MASCSTELRRSLLLQAAHNRSSHGLNVHQYADDTQLYLSVLSDDASVAVERLDACLVDVKVWLKASHLRLNPTKTQITWLGSGRAKVDTDEVSLLASRVHVLDAALNLGVLFQPVSYTHLTLPTKRIV